jgi:CBS domain-containing protein
MTYRQMSEIVRRQKPIALPPTATVREACRQMQDRRIGAILVTDEHGRLVGIFTGRDAVRVLAEASEPAQTALRDVMTRNPETMPPAKTAIDALRLMQDSGFRHVPVVTEAGELLASYRATTFAGSSRTGWTRRPDTGSASNAERQRSSSERQVRRLGRSD